MLTILSSFALILAVLVVTTLLPPYFIIPAAALVAVVGAGEVRPILVERRIAGAGRIVPGVVTRLEPMKRIRKHPLEAKWTVAYRYDVAGRAHRGRSRPLPWQVIDGLQAGDAIAVNLDPGDDERNAWVAGGGTGNGSGPLP